MATVEECEAALHDLASLLGSVDAETRTRHIPDRSVRVEVTDLETAFSGRLSKGGITDIAVGAPAKADIRIRLRSDDLLALTQGKLNFALAWATGRVKVDASIADLLRLRTLL